MDTCKGRFSVRAMCRVLEVSPSGYYEWLRRVPSLRSDLNAVLVKAIREEHDASGKRYGSPMIYHRLRSRGVACSENRVARLMRAHGIRAKQAKKYVATTDSDHRLPPAPNVLGRQFSTSHPDRAWSADITYIWTREGWLYLAVILDLYSRRVVGWATSHTRDCSLVTQALRQALQSRRPAKELLHHSDRGCQYASHEYQLVLEQAGLVVSMSRKGNCWDNAPVESFFATLKRELVEDRRFESRADARRAIFEYIEVWYNRKRLHSSLGYVSPVHFEEQMVNQTAARAA